MEPGEGSAAPKATVALPGTDVNLAGRAPARLAVHCSLATGGPGAATRHAPFGRPRHPLGTFPCGKVPRPPAGGRNLPQETDSLWKAGNGPTFLFPYHKGFRLCGGDQGAFRSPPGPLRGPSLYAWTKPPTRNRFLVEGRKRAYLSFPVSQRVSPLRRRPGGFPIAPWTPSGPIPIYMDETSHKKQIPCGRQETGLPFFLPYHKGFRLCGGDQGAFRSPPGPLRGPSLYEWEKHPTRNKSLAEGRKRAYLSFPVSQEISPLRRRPKGFPIALWKPSGAGRKPCLDAVLACCETKGFTFTWACEKEGTLFHYLCVWPLLSERPHTFLLLLFPNRRMEQRQHGENLQPPRQHQQAEHHLREGAVPGEILHGANGPQPRPHVAHAGKGRAEVGLQIISALQGHQQRSRIAPWSHRRK